MYCEGSSWKTQGFSLSQKARAHSTELFDKVKKVGEPSSVFHSLKLDRTFWPVEGVFNIFVLD